MDIIIFKAGRMIGPLNRESVVGMIARGEVSENDLAQCGGVEVWVPLRRMFPPKTAPTKLERGLEIARASGLKFWTALHFNPLRVGLASLLAGCVLIVFPRWTFVFFIPALVSAVFAGAILLTRRHFASGASLSVGSLVLPAIFLLAGREDSGIAHRLPLLPSPSIESVIPAPKPPAFPAKPTPPASFSGLALPQPVRPSPTPRPVPPI